MDSLQKIEQKTKSAFINLRFLIILFKAHERRFFVDKLSGL